MNMQNINQRWQPLDKIAFQDSTMYGRDYTVLMTAVRLGIISGN